MKNNRGLTLVELIIVIAILSIISLMFIATFRRIQENVNEAKTADQIFNEAIESFFHLNKNLNRFFDSNGNIITCIRISSLIERGFLEETDKYTMNDTFRVTVDPNGVFKESKKMNNQEQIDTECQYDQLSLSNTVSSSTPIAQNIGSRTNIDTFTLTNRISMEKINTFNIGLEFDFQALLNGNSLRTDEPGRIEITLNNLFVFDPENASPNVSGTLNSPTVIITLNTNDFTKDTPPVFNKQYSFNIRFQGNVNDNQLNTPSDLFNKIDIILFNTTGTQITETIPNLPKVIITRRNTIAIN